MWIIPRQLSFLASLVSEDSTPESAWLSEQPELAYTWNMKSLPARSWLRVWKTVPWIQRLSGRMCAHLTPAAGPPWIWSSADSPVPTSVSPDNERALQGKSRDSGAKCAGSSANAGRPSSSSKTFQDFYPLDPFAIYQKGTWLKAQPNLFEDSALFSEIWPTSGSMQSGRVYLRPTWAPANSANESSSWPTPVANDDNKTPEAHLAMKERMGGNRTAITSLQVKVQAWRTLDVPATGGPRNRKDSIGNGHQTTLGEQAETIWQTPATDSFRSRGGDRKDEQGLDQQARLWATPQSRDFKSGEAAQIREFHTGHPDPVSANSGNASSSDGPNSPRLWPTTRVNERGAYTCDKGNPESRRPTLDGLAKGGTARKLNYRFVSWLMGLHPEWVSLIPLERKSYERWVDRSSLLVRQWLSAYSRSVRASVRSTKTADSD